MDESDPAARARRRSFTAEYKAAIVDEYDQFARGAPERGALLRREGLHSSHIAEWRNQRDAAALKGLSPKGRAKRSREQVELERLRRRGRRPPRHRRTTPGATRQRAPRCPAPGHRRARYESVGR